MGTDHDTAEFAVATIATWWRKVGSAAHPRASRLLLTAAAGTSKWNRIEHRRFSHISMNWRGWPLTSHEVVVHTIAATPPTGLTVDAELDTGSYSKGIRIPDHDTKTLETTGILTHRDFHGEWNYSLNPAHREISVLSIRTL